jgi:hypothetical protein
MAQSMEEMNAIGIDYGMGKTNRDENFHYGVISQNEVLQSWADSSEAIYPDPDTCETCHGIGTIGQTDEAHGELQDCSDCNGEGTITDDMTEPIGFEYHADGYDCVCSDDGDIFIIKSPYFTYCAYCSPCAPGAGYLMSPNPAGIMAYCFGHDWFEDGKAPYPVFDCTNGLPVERKE